MRLWGGGEHKKDSRICHVMKTEGHLFSSVRQSWRTLAVLVLGFKCPDTSYKPTGFIKSNSPEIKKVRGDHVTLTKGPMRSITSTMGFIPNEAKRQPIM